MHYSFSRHSSHSGNPSVVSRIFSTLVGIFLLVIGLGFFSITVPQARDGLKYQKWLKTPCVVTSVKASNDGKSYHLNITYT